MRRSPAAEAKRSKAVEQRMKESQKQPDKPIPESQKKQKRNPSRKTK